MTDYLHNLVTRSLSMSPAIQPRLASLFEPPDRDEPVLPTLQVETDAQPGYPTVKPGPDRFPEPTQISAHSQAAPSAETVSTKAEQPDSMRISRSPGHVNSVTPDFSKELRPQEPPAIIAAMITSRPMEAGPAEPVTAIRDSSSFPMPDTIGRHQPTRTPTLRPPTSQPQMIPDLKPAAPPEPVAPSRVSMPEPRLAPTVQVTIGRIEVRATPSSASSPQPRRSIPPMSLEEYLRAKRGER